MNTTMLKYDARRLLPFWLTSAIALASYYVVAAAPLHPTSSLPFNSFPTVLCAVLFGLMIGGRLAADTGGTHAFVLSRGLTRRQLFLHRLVLGLLVIVATSVLLWLLLASSLRSNVHRWLQFEDAIYYPMLSQFESQVAFRFFKFAVVALLVIVFLQTLRGVRDADLTSTAGGQLKFWLAELPIQLMFIVPVTAMAFNSTFMLVPLGGMIWSWAPYILALIFGALAFYASCYVEAGR